MSRHQLTADELREWQTAFQKHGRDGLAARFRDKTRRSEKVVVGCHRAYRSEMLDTGSRAHLVLIPGSARDAARTHNDSVAQKGKASLPGD